MTDYVPSSAVLPRNHKIPTMNRGTIIGEAGALMGLWANGLGFPSTTHTPGACLPQSNRSKSQTSRRSRTSSLSMMIRMLSLVGERRGR